LCVTVCRWCSCMYCFLNCTRLLSCMVLQ
jgi:hypothetical protein